MKHRSTLLAAGLLGATGVALGAVGTHALEAFLMEKGTAHAWETAARYHLLHAVALLAVGVWLRHAQGTAARRAGWAARCWTAGVVLFSGSLYGYAVGGPQLLVYVTPLGGLALIAGWICVVAGAVAKEA